MFSTDIVLVFLDPVVLHIVDALVVETFTAAHAGVGFVLGGLVVRAVAQETVVAWTLEIHLSLTHIPNCSALRIGELASELVTEQASEVEVLVTLGNTTLVEATFAPRCLFFLAFLFLP